jgi:transcriptional regulator with XRE-family HTH domain
MSRAELAEAVNAYLWNRGVRECLSESDIGRYERGESRWPRADRRQGLRAVLGAGTDAQLGLFITNRSPSSEEPLQVDGTASVPASAPAPGPGSVLPGSSSRVVLHWTGAKAYALRIAMRMSIRDFAAKLGLNASVVGMWQPTSTRRLRHETHQILDAMLALATDDDMLRFDLALQEMGESR